MLILSRKNGQKIIINDNIEITILESKNDNCKIAVNAPRDVKIYREEVYNQIQESNKQSKDTTVDILKDIEKLLPNMPVESDKQDKAPVPPKTSVIIKKKKN